ncbi:MAG TPA: hypothetical protein PLV19_05470 [Nitrosomonas sp.]|nr:hypothetical protein [Nitrosomonas sp.]HQX13602.1 hypothetical protein [Nitrosomonas sp.]HRB20426.1 hypothetical protein [Nitrosomonas sp.]HRB32988.1 hypothetical protein [Nitrosomonas sp.]HRB45649.1 hypothetical protein [Nitrosomonas sp.]
MAVTSVGAMLASSRSLLNLSCNANIQSGVRVHVDARFSAVHAGEFSLASISE